MLTEHKWDINPHDFVCEGLRDAAPMKKGKKGKRKKKRNNNTIHSASLLAYEFRFGLLYPAAPVEMIKNLKMF